MERITGLEEFGNYLTAMLVIDTFFLNEDRHTNNIAVIYNEKTRKYSYSPLFDQGLCLFADTSQDYPLEQSVEKCLEIIEAKPFSRDFDGQLDAAEELYGVQLRFCFTITEVEQELEQMKAFYPEQACLRVKQLIGRQIRKYCYLTE